MRWKLHLHFHKDSYLWDTLPEADGGQVLAVKMEYMSALQNDFDDFKPSLFGTVSFPSDLKTKPVAAPYGC